MKKQDIITHISGVIAEHIRSNFNPQNDQLNVEQVALLLEVKEGSIRSFVYKDTLPIRSEKINGKRLFFVEEVALHLALKAIPLCLMYMEGAK